MSEAMAAAGPTTDERRSARAATPPPPRTEPEARPMPVTPVRPVLAPRPRWDTATILSGAGRILISVGLLIIGFVGYELFGTNITEARNQGKLKADLATRFNGGASAATAPGAPPIDTSQPNDAAAPPDPPNGTAVATIKIPKIGVDKAVVEGVELTDLKKGPGHYPGTPLPGQPGNAAIAGHRTTYGAPFFRIDELAPGDPILVTTVQGRFRYEVESTKVIKPTDLSVIAPTSDSRLTLTSCNPRLSAKERIVVQAVLKGPAALAPVPPIVPSGSASAGSGGVVQPRTTLPYDEVVGAAADPKGRVPAAKYGAATAAIALLGWLAGRRWRRLPAWGLAAAPFFVCLFFFYANLARIIPS